MRSHGTIGKYRLEHCRCNECRAINTEYSRRYRAGIGQPKAPRPVRATTCRVDRCQKARAGSKSLCRMHSERLYKHGSVDWEPLTRDERFWQQVHRTRECWLWIGSQLPKGYGMFGSELAHRYAYETCVGPILAGETVDHLCGVKACVNPEHLDVTSGAENVRRAVRIGHGYRAPETCKRGHDWRIYPPRISYRANGSEQRRCSQCEQLFRPRRRSVRAA